jgi:hypothetical protein
MRQVPQLARIDGPVSPDIKIAAGAGGKASPDLSIGNG